MAKRAATATAAKNAVKKNAAPSAQSAAMTTPIDPRMQRRVVVERIRPQVDCGRFPIKRVPGEQVVVLADVHADGHDKLAVVLMHRREGAADWTETPMD